jgi:hypothetical protein
MIFAKSGMSKVKYLKKPDYQNKSFKGKTQSDSTGKGSKEKEDPICKDRKES